MQLMPWRRHAALLSGLRIGFGLRFACLAAATLAACAQAESGSDKPDLGTVVSSPDLKSTDLRGNGDLSSPKDAEPDLTKVDLLTFECGDNICNGGEDCVTCAADCGDCTVCPEGFGDCNSNPGCETNLNTTSNCGGCGSLCAQVGGTNDCVLVGSTYQCQPTCAAGHADCDGDPKNGCETDLDDPSTCGACDHACVNPHGSTVCTTTGADFFCAPTCAQGWAACGVLDNGCTTDVSSDPDQCGNCDRKCAATNTTARSCDSGTCKPTCATGFADCNTPAGTSPDNGCEVNGATDRGEPDNSCNGRSFSVGEGGSGVEAQSRLVVAGDKDTYRINFTEGDHFCFPGTSQSYYALVYVDGEGLDPLKYDLAACDNSWSNINSTAICISWGGTCAADDSRTFSFQISGPQSCSPYSLHWQFCGSSKCPGC